MTLTSRFSVASVAADAEAYTAAMVAMDTDKCLAIEKRYSLDGNTPEVVSTALATLLHRLRAIAAGDAAKPVCIGCGMHPDEIEEYRDMAEAEETTPDAFVRACEGTYNPENGHFACTDCYVEMGCPSASGAGWKAH